MKRVIIVHCWEGAPEQAWYPWLKKELESKGFEVIVPQLPDTDSPRVKKWIPALASAVGVVDELTYFVGHGMGCQTIARFLEGLPEGQKAGGVVFVAGFFKRLTGLDGDANSKETEEDWLSTKPNFDKVKSHMRRNIAIFSDDDPFVPLDNQDDFRDSLGSKVIIEHGMNHFNGASKCFELSVALESVLKLAHN